MKRKIEADIYSIRATNIIIIPSGYKGTKIAVSEDPAYNLDVWYMSEEELQNLIKDSEKEEMYNNLLREA